MSCFQKQRALATLFSVVSGYADVVCIVRYQAFATMMTGNMVWLARVAVDPEPNYQPLARYPIMTSTPIKGDLS